VEVQETLFSITDFGRFQLSRFVWVFTK